jgi:Glutamine cyclotransferase
MLNYTPFCQPVARTKISASGKANKNNQSLALYAILLTLFVLLSPSAKAARSLPQDGLALSYEVIKTLPHDSDLFTQGLIVADGKLIESSGLYRKSMVRSYDIETGETEQQTALPQQIFAEGITLFNNRLYLLTWRAGLVYTLNPKTLKVNGSKSYQGQGWGITHDGTQLITSDGSHLLSFRDAKSFKVGAQLAVFDPYLETPLRNLNELEYVQGQIWANRWQTPYIYRIDAETGKVTGVLDLTALIPADKRSSNQDVLNGIAWDEQQQGFWVTGKYWNLRYLIRVTQADLLTPPSAPSKPAISSVFIDPENNKTNGVVPDQTHNNRDK